MRRKVIQIAGSTQLVSLPRQWAKRNNIQRGQEVEVTEDGSRVIISAGSAEHQEQRAHLPIDELGSLTPRCVSAYYKRGIDALRVTYNNQASIKVIHEALAKDTAGFEILEQGENHSLIKHVAGDVTEFESVLRRTILLLNTMSDETLSAFQKKRYSALSNLAFLEQANNRFTTNCMRYLNTKGAPEEFQKTGPIYHVVETLEHLGDEYKYICQHFSKLDDDTTIKRDVLKLFERANKIVRTYNELFYKFDGEKAAKFNEERHAIMDEAHVLLKKKLAYPEIWLVFHSMNLSEKAYEVIDSLLILRLPLVEKP